jgi:hypothetical protein
MSAGTAIAEAPAARVASDALAPLRRALALDFSQPLVFALLAIAYAASRAPFIDNGYGTKPDAWRIALTGYWLWDKHAFYPSRLPGYPVPELSYAAVIKGGWLATNSLTVLVSLAGLWFFARIVREVKVPLPALLVAGFAFNPLLWINSMNTMDYTWALTFILATYCALLTKHDVWAGVAMGLAIGSRIPSASFVVPYAYYLWRQDRREEIRPFLVTAVGVAMLAFAPIIWRYGPSFFNFYDAKVAYRDVIRLLAKDSLGLIGAGALAAAFVVSLPRILRRLPRDLMRDPDVGVWAIAVVLVAITFFRLPHEAAYLIPLFPFAYLLVGRYFYPAALAGAIAIIVLAGFVDLTTTSHEVAASSIRDLRVGQGMLLSNRSTQRAQLAYARDIEQFDAPQNSVVIIGFVYPQFAVRNRDRLQLGLLDKDKSAISQLTDKGYAYDPEKRVTYVWLLDPNGLRRYRQQNAKLFYTPDAGRSTMALYHYSIGLYGGTVIEQGKAPSGGKDRGGRNQR